MSCRSRRGEASRSLGVALAAGMLLMGCARASAPPGGPPDELPPFLVVTSPDTFAILEEWDGPVVFGFSERISERPAAGSWTDAVTISPESGPVAVRHRSESLEIRPEGGFLPGRVYRVSLKPVVRDLFSNVMLDPFELVFSTGPEFDEAVLAGLVWDRITGEGLRDHRVQAVAAGDTALVHVASTDSTGIFTLRYLPPGDFTVTAFLDRNRNRSLDSTEARGVERAGLTPTDTVLLSIPVLAPDTTPAVLASADLMDSLAIRLTFDDPLNPEAPTDDVEWTLLREADSIPLFVGRGIYHPAGLDSLREADREAAGQTAPEETAPLAGRGPAGQGPRTTTPDGRPLPGRTLFLPLSTPLPPGQAYLVDVENVTNLSGVTGGGGSARIVLPAVDTTTPPDTASTGDSIGGVPPDTGTALRLGAAPGGSGWLRPRVLRLGTREESR